MEACGSTAKHGLFRLVPGGRLEFASAVRGATRWLRLEFLVIIAGDCGRVRGVSDSRYPFLKARLPDEEFDSLRAWACQRPWRGKGTRFITGMGKTLTYPSVMALPGLLLAGLPLAAGIARSRGQSEGVFATIGHCANRRLPAGCRGCATVKGCPRGWPWCGNCCRNFILQLGRCAIGEINTRSSHFLGA